MREAYSVYLLHTFYARGKVFVYVSAQLVLREKWEMVSECLFKFKSKFQLDLAFITTFLKIMFAFC